MEESNYGRCRVGAEHDFLCVLADAAARTGRADEKGALQYVPRRRRVLLDAVAALGVLDDELYFVGVEGLKLPSTSDWPPECSEIKLVVRHVTARPAIGAVALVVGAVLKNGEPPQIVVF